MQAMPDSRATPPAALVAPLLAVLFLAGCGGEPDPVTDRDRVLRFELTEYKIEPQVVRVEAPGRVRIVATNSGRLTHNLKVRSEDRVRGERPEEFGGTEATAFPGERQLGEATVEPGRYELVCTIGNHDDLGQTGTLIVEDGG